MGEERQEVNPDTILQQKINRLIDSYILEMQYGPLNKDFVKQRFNEEMDRLIKTHNQQYPPKEMP